MPEPLLRVSSLSKAFVARGQDGPPIRAVDGLDLTIDRGESVGLVGESGSGKSTVARLILRLIEPSAGQIEFDGRDITRFGPAAMLPVRRRMQAVFQDPYASLNAKFTIRDVLVEPFEVHGIRGAPRTDAGLTSLLASVGLDGSLLDKRTHVLSGGQLQRVAIARALALEPDFIVADEPTSALDVSVQAQIVNLFLAIQRARGVAYMFISHDLDLVGHVSDRIAVMYLGIVVETARSRDILRRPLHPYTQALISAVPIPRPELQRGRRRIILNGDPPNAAAVPPGCRFHPRCPIAEAICTMEIPPLRPMPGPGGHSVACHLAPDRTEASGRAITEAARGVAARQSGSRSPGMPGVGEAGGPMATPIETPEVGRGSPPTRSDT
jgi:oligopeptide/dipeptide ABC transporter ATP-binding protein